MKVIDNYCFLYAGVIVSVMKVNFCMSVEKFWVSATK